jgi:hypothetical protein
MLPRGYYPNEEDNKMCEQRYLCKPTYRILLQQIGTDLFRKQLHPNVWINSLMNEYKWDGKSMTDGWVPSYNNPDNSGWDAPAEPIMPNWIITDMRFPNEMKAVKDRGGITIRVTRNKFNISNIKEARAYLRSFEEYKDRHDGDSIVISIANALWLENQKLHESETALDDAVFDYEIDNSGTIEELIEKVREILIKEKII